MMRDARKALRTLSATGVLACTVGCAPASTTAFVPGPDASDGAVPTREAAIPMPPPPCVDATGYACASGTYPITAKHDALRSGWYSDQPNLHPSIVGGSTFGRLFKTQLTLAPTEVVMAQPLVFGTTVFIVTESNNLYALDAETGAIHASRALGPAWKGSDIGCADLPLVGITGAPLIDPATATAYFFSKTYKADASASVWYAHAVDVQTLVERPNFPVEIQGTATNDPNITFNATYEMQRPGLLLMNGVVYAAFGAHCDIGPYHGYVIGVGLQGRITTMFATEAGPSAVRGAGIWLSGGGIVSDGPGRMFFATGNTYSNSMITPIAGKSPPEMLGESVVRLGLLPDGSLKALDFFAPYDAADLDAADLEIGSAGPVALPDSFGTPDHPHLLITGGKEGHLYTLDRDDLGGFRQGPNQGDAYLSEVAAGAGLWSPPAVWPGDGGWVYITPKHAPVQAFRYAPRGDGIPTLAAAGMTSDIYGYDSGSPIVTSDGITSASAVVWVTYTTGAWEPGSLRAYKALPDPKSGKLVQIYEDAYGKSAKFQVPGVGNGRIYLGTADGAVLGYGAHASKVLSGGPIDFGTLNLHESLTATLVLTADQATQVTSIESNNIVFKAGDSTPALPASLNAHDTLSLPVTFIAAEAQLYVGALDIVTTKGPVAVSMRGLGQTDKGKLRVSPTSVRYGGVAIGGYKSINLVLTNVGATDLTFSSITLPTAPFGVIGAPSVGQVLSAGASATVTTNFAPTQTGTFAATMAIAGNSLEIPIYLSGTGAIPAVLVIDPLQIDFGTIAVGAAMDTDFSVTNAGGVEMIITKSKPPTLGTFVPTTILAEGSTVPPGNTVVEHVSFQPMAEGPFEDSWIIGSSAGSGTKTVVFRGRGGIVAPAGAN